MVKRKVGRPTKYRESVAKAICLRLMMGESLNKICKLDNYPKKTTVYRWIIEKPEFRDKYESAREMQQEHYLDEMLEIADDTSEDFVETEKGVTFDREHVQRSKLRIESRRWIMERLAPKRYGQKQAIDHSSSDGSMVPPVPVYNIKK